jgi:hypothetical protein
MEEGRLEEWKIGRGEEGRMEGEGNNALFSFNLPFPFFYAFSFFLTVRKGLGSL